MTSGVVTFDAGKFAQRFPLIVGDMQMYFDEAALLLKNDHTSLVQDLTERAILLNMLTAHIATLAAADATRVGRLSGATEGSVNVSLDMGAVYGGQAWFAQTQYGAQYWQMTGKYRRARFIFARPRRC